MKKNKMKIVNKILRLDSRCLYLYIHQNGFYCSAVNIIWVTVIVVLTVKLFESNANSKRMLFFLSFGPHFQLKIEYWILYHMVGFNHATCANLISAGLFVRIENRRRTQIKNMNTAIVCMMIEATIKYNICVL